MSDSALALPARTVQARKRRGSLRPLLWKEWREQRPVLLSGLLILALMPLFAGFASMLRISPEPLRAAADVTARAAPAILWPLIALAAGAVAVAGDHGAGRLTFLLSRPSDRRLVWGVKAAAASVTVAVVVLASEMLSRVLIDVTQTAPFSVFGDVVLSGSDNDQLLGLLGFPGIVCLFLACALFYSVWVPRPLTAVFAGGITALAAYVGVHFVWWNVDVFPRLTNARLAWGPLLGAAAFAVASAALFHRGEMLRGRATTLRALALGGGALATLALVLAGAAAIEARSPSGAVLFTEISGSPDGRLAATVRRLDGASRTVWVTDPGARRFVDAAPRLSEAPRFSPDGGLLAFTAHGIWRDPRLMLWPTDGDWATLAGGLEQWYYGPGRLAFAPDGRSLALQPGSGELVIVDIATGELRQGPQPCHLRGWAAGRIVTYCYRWNEEPARLRLVDPASADDDAQAEIRLPGTQGLEASGDRTWDLHAAVLRRPTPDGAELVVVDLTTLTHRVVARHGPDRRFSAATGGGVVAWVERETGDEPAAARGIDLWLKQGDREPRHVGRFRGYFGSLSIDPNGRWVVLQGSFAEGAEVPTGRSIAFAVEDERRVELEARHAWATGPPVWLGADLVAYMVDPGMAPKMFGESARDRAGGRAVRVQDLVTGESWEVEPLR